MSRNVRSGLISKRGPSRTASHVIRSSETTATDCPSRNCGEAQRSSPHSGSGATWEASHCRKGLSSQSQFTGLPTQRRNFIKDQHLSSCHVGIWKEAVVAKFQAFLDSNYRNWRVYTNSYCKIGRRGALESQLLLLSSTQLHCKRNFVWQWTGSRIAKHISTVKWRHELRFIYVTCAISSSISFNHMWPPWGRLLFDYQNERECCVDHSACRTLPTIISINVGWLTLWRLMTYIYVVPHRYPPEVAFYIISQQIYIPNILNMLHILRFFLFKMPFVS
jgi:hypothetical protein